MKKSHTTNTFADGLIMDLNPVVTPNSALTNCLNGTIVTFNGNENALQNDMGNGRVKTAYLPEGYVPLGTAELGGIVYVVSYNPQTNKCQIGSFPSPERNIDSAEEGDDFNVTLTNEDFGFNSTNGAKIYYLKKKLGKELTFNPGDKFVVYGDTIAKNYYKFYNSAEYTQSDVSKAKNQTLKLKLGAITNDGKLVEFTDLKSFTIEKPVIAPEEVSSGSAEYHIMQHDNSSGTASEKLDSAASLASQQYNIFSSKVSGQLVIIAELIKFDNFSATIKHKFNSGTTKTYFPEITFDLSGDEEFMPYAIKCELMLSKITTQDTSTIGIAYYKNIATYTVEYESGETRELSTSKDGDFKNYTISKNLFNDAENQDDNFKSIISTIKGIDFNKNEDQRSYILKYTFTPCMNWGEITQLAVSGTVDLSKLGTGYMNIAQWKYYNQPNKQIVNWGFEIYEEDGKTVNDLKINFYSIVGKSDNTYEVKKLKFNTDKKTSYHGNFSYDLPLNQEWYKYEDCTADIKTDEENHITAASNTKNTLDSNNLYLVEFILKYIDSSDASAKTEIEDIKFYKWMYTNGVFNSKYYTENDFNTLQPEFDIDYSVDYSSTTKQPEYIGKNKYLVKIQNPYTLYGVINPEIEVKTEEEIEKLKTSKSSLSCIQTRTNVTIDASVEFKLKQDYNIFSLGGIDKDTFNFNINDIKTTASSTPTPLGQEDSDYKNLLYSKDGDASIIEGELELAISEDIVEGELGKDNSDSILKWYNKPRKTNAAYYNKEEKAITPTFENNTYKFSLTIPTLQLVKAYCSKKEDTLTYTGNLKPLAYDEDTFDKYNLELKRKIHNSAPEWSKSIDGKSYDIYWWIPKYFGTYGWLDTGKKKNARSENVGKLTRTENNYVEVCRGRQFNWDDKDIKAQENNQGWSGPVIYGAHKFGDGGSFNMLGREIIPGISLDSSCWGKKRIELIINNNEGVYYPITTNFEFFINGGCGAFDNIIESSYEFYQMFATFLNTHYRYVSESSQYKCLVPDNIFYMKDCNYGLICQLGLSQKSEELFINIKLQDNQKINISDINNKLALFGGPDSNNTKPKINKLQDNTNYIFTTLFKETSENNLRTYLSSIRTSYNTLIYDYDGKTKLEESTKSFKPGEVYTRTTSGSFEAGINNKSFDCLYYVKQSGSSEDGYEIKKNIFEKTAKTPTNNGINVKLVIGEDNYIQLKDTTYNGDITSYQTTGKSGNCYSGSYSNYGRGWQVLQLFEIHARPFPSYEFTYNYSPYYCEQYKEDFSN